MKAGVGQRTLLSCTFLYLVPRSLAAAKAPWSEDSWASDHVRANRLTIPKNTEPNLKPGSQMPHENHDEAAKRCGNETY
jgi:hypothetical protein